MLRAVWLRGPVHASLECGRESLQRRWWIMNLGFIGLGKMGTGMARNLIRAGHVVAVYNRSREKAKALAGAGARVTPSPADAARGADVIMTMLADDPAVEAIVFGNDGIASAM